MLKLIDLYLLLIPIKKFHTIILLLLFFFFYTGFECIAIFEKFFSKFNASSIKLMIELHSINYYSQYLNKN
jgi:hypothetical protein